MVRQEEAEVRVWGRTEPFDAARSDMHSPSTMKDVLVLKPDFSHLLNNNKNRLEMCPSIGAGCLCG